MGTGRCPRWALEAVGGGVVPLQAVRLPLGEGGRDLGSELGLLARRARPLALHMALRMGGVPQMMPPPPRP